MSRNQSPDRKRKEQIRGRDRKNYTKRYVCTVCGKITKTQIHHWFYSDVYDPRSLIEVCQKCHDVVDAVSAASGRDMPIEQLTIEINGCKMR